MLRCVRSAGLSERTEKQQRQCQCVAVLESVWLMVGAENGDQKTSIGSIPRSVLIVLRKT